jgi:uncharacterized protein YecT (DUF1311 family)
VITNARARAALIAPAILVLGLRSIALAGDPPLDCRSGGSTQHEMNACAGRRADRAKKQLGLLLADLRRVLPVDASRELSELQRRWAALRDADCSWERSLHVGGSVGPMLQAHCVADLTEQRIERLKTLLCEGAGMTGPCEASQTY